MFYLKEALEKFKHSYELKPSDEALKEIINVKFAMKYSGIKEDIDFTKENEINSELVLKCSEEVKDIWEQINNGTEYENLSQTFIYDGRHNLDDYYVNVQEVLDEWKNDYRSNIG